ncbi:A-kinase anchor protein 5 isoform X1 [Cricetulus griseus]|uniref:A-kinase anchor protein 5 isoform X1 n=1 Tax=Cricetulus griseus TaxID=10029 RepID=UPI000F73863D|nr:A-kinase anchor protein 5 isoform X1 [Cricetulus griseus]
MKECSVKMETKVSEIQIETKDEKGPVAVSPQEERQQRKPATLCFKRRKKANKMKPKSGSKTAEATKKHPPEAGASDQPQPAGAWASIKRLVTHRKRSGSSEKQKPSEAEVQPEDSALPKKKAKSRLKIPCIRFSRGAKRGHHSKLTDDSDYNLRVQGGAEDLETKTQTQSTDQAKSIQGPQEGGLVDSKEAQESHVSNSITSRENVISVELELEKEASAIQMGTPVLEKETKGIKEKPSVQAQQASPLGSSETDSPRPVASDVPASPATTYQRSVEEPRDGIQESAPSRKDDRSGKSTAEEKKSGEIVLGQAKETTLSQTEKATVSQADKSAMAQAEEGTMAAMAQTEEGKLSQAEEASVAQAEEVALARAEEAIVAQTEEGKLSRAEEATMAQTEKGKLSQAEEAAVAIVAQVEEASVAQAEEVALAQAEEATMAQAEEGKLSQAEEAAVATVAQTEEGKLSQAEEASVAQAEEVALAQAEEATVAQAEETAVAQAVEGKLSQTEEASVAQAEEVALAQAEEATVAQAEETAVAQAKEDAVAQAKEDTVAQVVEGKLSQTEEAALSQAPDLKENGIDTEKPRSEESKRMEPIAIIITDTEISEFDVKKSKNVPKQFLISMENEQVGVFANDSDFEGRTSEQYETLLIETASSLVNNAIQLSVEQLVNEMVSEDNKINTLLQ